MQSDLKSVGVDTTIRQEDGIVALQSFEIRDFQMGNVGWIADYDDPMTYLALMRSDTGAQNYGDYKNPAYDALLDKADNEPDAARRAADLAAGRADDARRRRRRADRRGREPQPGRSAHHRLGRQRRRRPPHPLPVSQ